MKPWQRNGAPMKIYEADFDIARSYSKSGLVYPARKSQVEAVTIPAILRMMANART